LALIFKRTDIPRSPDTSIRHIKWLISVVHKITGEEVTRAWVDKRKTEFNKVKRARQ
jgi:hypothetical protein